MDEAVGGGVGGLGRGRGEGGGEVWGLGRGELREGLGI